MGFDVKALIAKVEQMVNGENNAANNGKIESPQEVSIFRSELDKAVQQGELTEESAAQIFGLETSGAGKGSGTKSGITINIDASTHVNITIEVRTAINEVIAQLLAAIQNLSDQMADIINVINGNQENLIYFLQQLFHQYLGNLGSDMSDIRSLLEQILGQVEIGNGHVGNIEEIMHQLLELELQNQAILLGLRDDARSGFNTLIALIEQNNASQEQQTEWLALIYDTINQFKNEQGQYNAQFQQYFQALMAMVQSGNMTLEQILAELQAIKNNTAESNELLNAIFQKLSSLEVGQNDLRNLILTLIQHCDENTLDIINALPGDMSGAITAMLNTIVDLLQNIHQDMPSDIPDYNGILQQILAAIGNIGNNGYDDTQVLQMLQAILDAILQCCGCGGNGGGSGSNEGNQEIPELTATNPYAYGNHNPGNEPAGSLSNNEAALMNFLNDLLTNPAGSHNNDDNGNTTGNGDTLGIDDIEKPARGFQDMYQFDNTTFTIYDINGRRVRTFRGSEIGLKEAAMKSLDPAQGKKVVIPDNTATIYGLNVNLNAGVYIIKAN